MFGSLFRRPLGRGRGFVRGGSLVWGSWGCPRGFGWARAFGLGARPTVLDPNEDRRLQILGFVATLYLASGLGLVCVSLVCACVGVLVWVCLGVCGVCASNPGLRCQGSFQGRASFTYKRLFFQTEPPSVSICPRHCAGGGLTLAGITPRHGGLGQCSCPPCSVTRGRSIVLLEDSADRRPSGRHDTR
jgi:hypothetical protein